MIEIIENIITMKHSKQIDRQVCWYI